MKEAKSTRIKKVRLITRKRFLNLVLPNLRGKTASKGIAWREFKKSGVCKCVHIVGLGTLEELLRIWDEKNEIPDPYSILLATTFLNWYGDWRNARTSEARRAAAHKSHKKNDKRKGARPPRHKLGDKK